MKNLLLGIVAVVGLTGLLCRPDCVTGPQMVAQAVSTPSTTTSTPTNATTPPAVPAVPMVPAAPKPVSGDLVIDFMGDIRGYVEPCG
jgi:hypothetical protein